MMFVLLLACHPVDSIVDSGCEDSGTMGWDWEGLSPDWTAEEVAAEVEEAVSYGLPQAEVVGLDILELLSRGDEDCPGHPSMISQPYVTLSGCTADTGYQYRGILVYEEQETLAEVGVFQERFTSTADFEIVYPDGGVFFGGGSIRSSLYRSSDPEFGDSLMNLVQGVWQDPNHEVEWLARGISSYLTIFVQHALDSDSFLTKLEGTYGIEDIHLYFDAVQIHPTVCESQPSEGRIWLRQPDTSWYQLHFDETCACPRLTWNQTEELGEVCVNLAPMVSQMNDFLEVTP